MSDLCYFLLLIKIQNQPTKFHKQINSKIQIFFKFYLQIIKN